MVQGRDTCKLYIVLQYIKFTPRIRLLFKRGGYLNMEACAYADYGGLVSDRRFTSSYCYFLCGSLFAWRSKRQCVVARSSVEAEFRVMAQLLWIVHVL